MYPSRLVKRRTTLKENASHIITRLETRYTDQLHSLDEGREPRKRHFLPGGAAEQLAKRLDTQQDLKDLYCLHYELREREANSLGRCLWQNFRHGRELEKQVKDLAESFYSRVMGDLQSQHACEAKDTRAKLLATIVLSEPLLDSPVLSRFIEHTMSATKGFSDRLLRFDELEDAQHWLDPDDQDSDKINRICLKQHIVCPFVLNEQGAVAPPNAQWPYKAEKQVYGITGGLGIYGVKIDPEFYKGSIPSGWIARKDVPWGQNNESEVARRLKEQSMMHTSIREVYGLARSQDKISFFMEWAEEDMEKHMDQDRIPSTALDTRMSWFEKLLGPADALRFLHHEALDRETGQQEPIRHGDIKAANIVLIKDQDGNSVLKLSDFGISSIGHGRQQGPCVDQLTYCPPEFMDNVRPKQTKTTKGDVWSMGCLAFEWLAWLMDGMGDGGRVGITALRESCSNTPSDTAIGDSTNRRLFIIERNDGCREHGSAIGNAHGEFETHMRTDDHGHDQCVVIKLNPAIDAYIETIAGENGSHTGRERRFICDVFAVLSKVALVPNPDDRGTMAEFCEQLKQVLADARSDKPQVGPS